MLRFDRLKHAASDCCPTCGQRILEPLSFKVDLQANALINGVKSVKVPARYAELIWLLHKHFPNTVERDIIINRVWGSEGAQVKTVDTTVCLARRFVEQIGYGIKNERSIGYRLVKL